MLVTHHPNAAALLAHAAAFLEASEAENGLILGLCAAHERSASAVGDGFLWISIGTAETPVAAAVRTPPFNLVLSSARPVHATRDALTALVNDLHAGGHALPGVSCPAEVGDVFADLWARRTGTTARITMRQGIYQLTQVVPPARPAAGMLRAARMDDEPLVIDWMGRFASDAGLPLAEADSYQRRVRSMILAGTLFVWDDGGVPVSMAFLQGRTPHGVRVSMVYTPSELRGRGYASSCVAAISAHALASGRRFCMLYTDLANPTSNALYQRIGYERVTDSVMIAFDG